MQNAIAYLHVGKVIQNKLSVRYSFILYTYILFSSSQTKFSKLQFIFLFSYVKTKYITLVELIKEG